MSKKRVVVALGGNALGSTVEEQLALVNNTASALVDLTEKNYEVIVSHGNGPQVGMINLAMDEYAASHKNSIAMPFPECSAMCQGYIGYHLQQAIRNELRSRGSSTNVVAVVTQIIIDENDPAFRHPTKPIGGFYTKEQADVIAKEKGFTFIEDAGRGYRRVVPSPTPQQIVEIDTINSLVNSGDIVVAAGGGGIPVVEKNSQLTGISAVIDKDKSSALLASSLHADILLILTAVDFVYIDFNTENQRALSKMSSSEALSHMKSGHFAKGSMLPKIEACLEFLGKTSDGTAIITSLARAKDALDGTVGTIIRNEDNGVSSWPQ